MIQTLFNSETTNSNQSQQSLGYSMLNQQGQKTIQSLLLVAATGLGKTVMMGGLARNWPMGRVMMLSHRFELNQQALKSFEWICQEPVDLEQADYRADQKANPDRIVVASVQTLNAKRKGKYRMERFNPNDFGLILIDEAHRSAAATYRRVIEYFKQNSNCKIVGVTATPDRLDKVGLGTVFDKVACNLDISWGIENGWLVPPKQIFVHIAGLDLSQIRTVGGDLDEKQLAKVVEQENNLHEMAKPIVDVCGKDKQAIVFTASVGHAHRISEMIRDYYQRSFGFVDSSTAVSLDGSLSPQDPKRRQIVRDFKEGRIQFLCNCGVATEGFDAPNVKVVAIGRPTKSRALYVQMLGRGTRPIPGIVEGLNGADERRRVIADSEKPNCLIMDFVGQSGRHSLVCSTDILAGNEPPEVVERANEIVGNKDFDGSTLDALREAKERIENEREARRAKVTVGVDYSLVETDSLYDLSVIPKDKKLPYTMQFHKPTEKQERMLLKLGYTTAQVEKLNKKRASEAIEHAIQNPINNFGRWLKTQKAKESK